MLHIISSLVLYFIFCTWTIFVGPSILQLHQPIIWLGYWTTATIWSQLFYWIIYSPLQIKRVAKYSLYNAMVQKLWYLVFWVLDLATRITCLGSINLYEAYCVWVGQNDIAYKNICLISCCYYYYFFCNWSLVVIAFNFMHHTTICFYKISYGQYHYNYSTT